MRIRESASHEVTTVRSSASVMDTNKRPIETNGHMAYRNAGGVPGPHHSQMRVGPLGPSGGHLSSAHRPGGPNRYPPNPQFSRSHFNGGGDDGHRSRYGQHIATSRRPYPDPGKDDDHPQGGAKASDAFVREQRERLRQKREDEAKRLEAQRCGEQNVYQSELEEFLMTPHVSCADPMKKMHEIMRVTYLDQAPPSVRPPSPPSSPPSHVDPPIHNSHHRTSSTSFSNKLPRPPIQPKDVKPPGPDEKASNPPSGSEIRNSSVPSNNQELKIGVLPGSSESRTKAISRQHRDPVQVFSTSRLKPDQLTAAAKRAVRAAASRDASPLRFGTPSNNSSDAAQLVGGQSSSSHAQRGIAGKRTKMPTPEEIISSTSIPTTFITPIKHNRLADPQDVLSGAMSPLCDVMLPAPHIPPPPVMVSEGPNGSHPVLGRSRDDEPSRGGAVRMQVTPNGRCPTEPQQAPLPLERLPTFQPSISAPKKDPVMEDLSFSSSSTDNSLNESNSNDDDSSDSSDSTSSDNEDNEDNDNEEDLKSPSNGEKEDQVEVKKEVIDDDQGKDSSNWKLGFLFRIDESEAKTSESRLTSSSGKAGVSKGRAAEQKANEARKSPTIHGVYGYDGSRLSEDSSDGEQIKSVVRPTPQVAPVPRTSDRQKSLLSSSDSSDENPVTPVKISKRELPTPKLPAAAGNKSKTAAKPKCNPRGRLRKTAHVILESKAKSKAYVSTDDSSSDSDDGGRPSKPLYKAALNRKPTPKKTASSTNKENLPRHSTTHTGNANTKQPTTSRVTKCQTSKSLSLVSAYRVRDSKPLNKKEQLIPPNAVPDLLFVFPENAIKKKIDKNQEKAEELTRVTNSRTSDANKKEVLLTLYAKNKDYNQNDPSNKSKDAKKRSRGQLVHSKEGNVSKISRPSKERDVQTPSQSLSENVEHLPTINAMETLCTSKRRREESNSGGTHPHKRSKNVLQNFSSEQDTEQPHVHRSTKNSRSSKRGSPRDSGSSRCQSRSSNHEDAPGPAMHSPASHQRSSRVPLEGESSVAFRCRQSNTLSCSSVVLPTTSTACSMPPAVVTPSSTPTVASSSVPPTASNPLDDHSRRSPASAVVRNSLLVPNDNPPNAPNEVRLSAGHYKPSLPAGFKKVIPQPISSVYPCIGALEGFSLEEKFFELFGVTEKKYQDRGKALKRIGDSEVDIIDRSVKYLEAFIFFALEGCALEQDPSTQKSAVPMFTQTIDLIRWVSSAFNNRKLSPPMSHKDFLVHCNPKLAVLCLFAQSLLSLKVYTIRSRELKESKNSLKKYCDTYDKRTSSNRTSQGGGSGGRGGSSNPTPACPSNPGGVGTGPTTASTPSGHSTTECRRAANSPSALSSTPSPAGSLNSESSTSSGYNTTPVTATPSPPQEPTTMIEVPQMEHEQLVRHYSVSDYLNNAVEMWAEAQKYIRENELETFFACLDAAVCPLSLHSSLDELVIYIKAGLREIERIRMHYSGAGDTAVPYAGGGRPGGRNISSESGTPSDPPVVNSQQ